MYGSELWGCCERQAVENVLLVACKKFLCTNVKSCNAAALGDCGRFPMWVESTKRTVKYWLRLLRMPNERYPRKCYNMLDQLGYVNWVSSVRQVLQNNGFNFVWIN